MEWLYHDLAGIRQEPDSAGFQKIVIKPALVGNLTWVRGSYDSASGQIVSEWKRAGDAVTLHVVVPPNTTATVYVPAKDTHSVLEDGKPASSSPGVKFLQSAHSANVYQVGSGEYTFSSR